DCSWRWSRSSRTRCTCCAGRSGPPGRSRGPCSYCVSSTSRLWRPARRRSCGCFYREGVTMPQIRANPNRMELLKLRRRGAVARRGHKLLKDKLDELMKEFQARIGANRRLRAEVERDLRAAYSQFAIARAEAGQAVLEPALMAGAPAHL